MGRARFSEKDNGARALIAAVRNATAAIKVGYVGDAAAKPAVDSPGLTVAELGEIHEYGIGVVPERNHIRGTIDAQTPQLIAELKRGATAVAKKKASPTQVILQFGLSIVAKIQQTMRNGVPPALSEKYSRRKAKKYPGRAHQTLIASGQMLQSVTSVLAKPGKDGPDK